MSGLLHMHMACAGVCSPALQALTGMGLLPVAC